VCCRARSAVDAHTSVRRQGGKAYMLEACDPRSVYCNTLDDFAPLAEGRCSPARLRRPCCRRDPETRETSLRLFSSLTVVKNSAAAGGPHTWRPRVDVDPSSVDPWLSGVGNGVYT
jgi:hypothetical protein